MIYDPMMAYRRDKKIGDLPIRLVENKALWRESAALFQLSDRGMEATVRGPENLYWLKQLREKGCIPEEQPFSLSAIGLCTDKAKVHFWRQETLPLPPAYLTDVDLVDSLKNAIGLAEDVGKEVRNAAATVARLILDPVRETPDKDRLWATVDSLAADQVYWSRLEAPFRLFVKELPGDVAHQKQEIDRWYRDVLRSTARDAFDETAGQLDHSARSLHGLVAGHRQLVRALGAIAKRYTIAPPAKPGASA
jgi:hypothetical protein